MPNVKANGIQIEYDTFGNNSFPALLLIMGGGSQMIHWEAEFCESLAKKGIFVIRFDNRDVGLSTKFEEAGIPDTVAAMKGEPFTLAYSLEDMADDAVRLLDRLAIEKAHICGASFGGMIAQIISYRHPDHVLSLTSIMSSTGNPKHLKIKPDILAEVYKPIPDEREAYVEHHVNMWRKVWSPGFPFEEKRVRTLMAESYDRSYYPQGLARQGVAVLAHGYQKSSIASIKAPTLVIHGDKDTLMSVEGGKETAQLIPGSKLLIIEGMGHDMPKAVWPKIITAISNHTIGAGHQTNSHRKSIPKVDLHVHYLPQAYREALSNCAATNPDGFPTPAWNPEQHLEVMGHLGITTSLLSLSSPHIHFGDGKATKILARKVNDAGAQLVNKHPHRFGLMASLPLPDVENSIEEIRYAMNVLHVDGFALPTNTRGIYLGNPCLDPILEALNQYQAVIVLHPNTPGSVPENVVEGLPMPMMEYFFDTTRTVINLILKRTLKRFPDIKFVVPHAGAFLSILADRLGLALQMMPGLFGISGQERTGSIDIFSELNQLYYDLAGVCLPRQLGALLQMIDVGHLLYGSDYPYTPESGCSFLAGDLDKTSLLTGKQRRSIYYDNAIKLFPRLSSF